ncbi:hypothetical protein RD792_002636 [Penstemon davidsonii]|uniref:Knottins-like domain-containing protein n=1 Tax=Penstemon davidsonii TaxID=160366 RepID=A0ABR0DRU1_9LAMI|nr:hypothetical protein RD792_002636 [Penstemon davidsonii]
MDTRLFGLVLLGIILVSFTRVEASVCETRSKEFRGLCIKSDNCASICEKEGYLTGTCKGFIWKCICEKDCKAGGATSPGGGSGGGPPDGSGDGPPDGGDGGAPDGPATSNMYY